MISRNKDKFVFYINNYIDWDQFNQLYNLNWIKKYIKSAYIVAHKVGLALSRAIIYRLEVAREKKQKREEIVEK